MNEAASTVVFCSISIDEPVTPPEPLPPLPAIPHMVAASPDRGAGTHLRATVSAFHRLGGSPAGAIAVFEPHLGTVVVASARPNWREGQIIDVTPPINACQIRRL